MHSYFCLIKCILDFMQYLCFMISGKVAQFIERENLFSLKDKVLVALSGGADSVALLRLLVTMGYSCEAAHCNFHLRGEESDRDEAFVRDFCSALNVSLFVQHFDTAKVANEQHISIEMAARDLRYAWFEELRRERQAAVIAVAHHKDDSVETFLLNLLRGTGINGLLGIRPVNGFVVRPLLCVSRAEILAYLEKIGQTFVTDSTNLQDEYTRNQIRLNLLPLMQRINPSVQDTIINTTLYLHEVYAVYKKGVADGVERVRTSRGLLIDALLQEPAPEALLHEVLYPLGFNASQVKDVFYALRSQSGKQFASKEWRVIKDRNELLIEKIQVVEDTNEIPHFHYTMEEMEISGQFIVPKDKCVACLDAAKIDGELNFRRWRHGDVFVPFGMKGRKNISDYLTDRKYSLLQKEKQWVLCCGEQIAWLVGERIDNRFSVNENTRKVVIIRVDYD